MFKYIYFQGHNIKSLCQTIVTTTRGTAPSLEAEAVVIQNKFETLLTLFSKCHSKYNSSEAVEDTEIDLLGNTLLHFVCPAYETGPFFSHSLNYF